MKKFLAIILAALMLVCTGCSSAQKTETTDTPTETSLEELVYSATTASEMEAIVAEKTSPEDQLLIAGCDSHLAWETLLASPALTLDAFMALTEQPLRMYKVAPLLPEAMEVVELPEKEQIALIKEHHAYSEALLRTEMLTPESLTVLCEWWGSKIISSEMKVLISMAIEIDRMTPEQQQRVIDTGNTFFQEQLLIQQQVNGEQLVCLAKSDVDKEWVGSEITWGASLSEAQKLEIASLGEEEIQLGFLRRGDLSFELLYEIADNNSFFGNDEARQLFAEAVEEAELSKEQMDELMIVASDILK